MPRVLENFQKKLLISCPDFMGIMPIFFMPTGYVEEKKKLITFSLGGKILSFVFLSVHCMIPHCNK